ncbi:MAG: hypothetical protein ACXABO_00655 [Promethearchaeota archaeon]|jgi:hypothetical protein
MVVREAGIIFRGFILVKRSYHKTTKGKIDKDLRSGLLSAILSFAESFFKDDSVEYFEGKKFSFTIAQDEIMSDDGSEPEVITSYAILDQEKKIEKYTRKIIQPLLKKVINEFISLNKGKNLSEVSQFKDFKLTLNRIFGTDTQTVDQKLKRVLSKDRIKKKKPQEEKDQDEKNH